MLIIIVIIIMNQSETERISYATDGITGRVSKSLCALIRAMALVM